MKKEVLLGDKIRSLIEEISSENDIPMCQASGIVAKVLSEPEIESEIIKSLPEDEGKQILTHLIENNILAACTGDNEYMFRER